ncbi:MAG: sulfide/dihydroorotate dehydrogenase-like FAD/NAD-binding protein [Eggerthellaceae bacterium]|nr:sulfide/dihydroorotate dehydrogenase-like FAD/NAD-binding protein [Eggerthellaceae bacterium]
MYPIESVEALNAEVTRMVVRAPEIARKIKPGQFIMLRIDEEGERIPLTMNEADPQTGTVTIVFQAVGATTMRLATLRAGDALLDFVGPLGNPTELEGARRACVVGGGLGTAIAYPQAKWLHDHGCEVDVITGFRSQDLVILKDEIEACSSRSIIMTDDGSNGNKGVVTEPLKRWIEEGANYDLVLAVGPIVMMKFVAATTREHGIKTLVSMNPLMIDGTGMCGGCRVKVGDEYLHACVDGPDFDGHLVDYDDAMRRGVMYRAYEGSARKKMAKRLAAEARDCDVAAAKRAAQVAGASAAAGEGAGAAGATPRRAARITLDPEMEAKLAAMEPEKAAKVRAAMEAKLAREEAARAASHAEATGAGQAVYAGEGE